MMTFTSMGYNISLILLKVMNNAIDLKTIHKKMACGCNILIKYHANGSIASLDSMLYFKKKKLFKIH